MQFINKVCRDSAVKPKKINLLIKTLNYQDNKFNLMRLTG